MWFAATLSREQPPLHTIDRYWAMDLPYLDLCPSQEVVRIALRGCWIGRERLGRDFTEWKYESWVIVTFHSMVALSNLWDNTESFFEYNGSHDGQKHCSLWTTEANDKDDGIRPRHYRTQQCTLTRNVLPPRVCPHRCLSIYRLRCEFLSIRISNFHLVSRHPKTSTSSLGSPGNRILLREPRLFLRVFIAWPIIVFVIFFSCKYLLFIPVLTLMTKTRYSLDGCYVCHGWYDTHPTK